MDVVEIEKKFAHRWQDKWRANDHEHHVIEQYLIRKGYLNIMMEIVDKDKSKSNNKSIIGNNCPIWVSWWQGEDGMPLIAKKCFHRLCACRGNHNIVLITKDNYTEYIDIPQRLIEKAEAGTMKYSHLSDLLRLKLLSKYGGLWIDSTVWCSRRIDDVYTNGMFVSLRNPPFYNWSVTTYRWAGFFLGSTANAYVTALAEAMEQYLLTEKKVIHYLLIDYLIDLLYKNVEEFRTMIDNLPLRNPNLHTLLNLLNEKFDPVVWNRLMEDTDFFKTTYRGNIFVSEDGAKTFCGYIANQ